MLNGLGNAIGQVASGVQDTVRAGSNFNARLFNADNDSVAERYITRFDRDDDGAIDLRSETSRSTFGGLRHQSVDRLASAADQLGDRDGRATAAEIEALLASYDTGAGLALSGDSYLEGRERQAFRDTHGPTSGFGAAREASTTEPAGPAGDAASADVPADAPADEPVAGGDAYGPAGGGYDIAADPYAPAIEDSYAPGVDISASAAAAAAGYSASAQFAASASVDPAHDVRGFDVTGQGVSGIRAGVSASGSLVADPYSAAQMYSGEGMAYGRRIPGEALYYGRRIPGDEIDGRRIPGRAIA